MASRGRGGRQRGHGYERTTASAVALALFGFDGKLTDPDCPVQTTRAVVKGSAGDIAMKHEGLWVPWVRKPGAAFPGGFRWSLECKSTEVWQPDKWLEQAAHNCSADGADQYAVIVDVKHKPVGQSWVLTPDHRGGPNPWVARTLDQFLDQEM